MRKLLLSYTSFLTLVLIGSSSFAKDSQCVDFSGYYVGLEKNYHIRQEGCSQISISSVEFRESPRDYHKVARINTDVYVLDGKAYGVSREKLPKNVPKEKEEWVWVFNNPVEISEVNEYRIATLDSAILTIFEHEMNSLVAHEPVKQLKCALTEEEAIKNIPESFKNGCIVRTIKFEKLEDGSLAYSVLGIALGAVQKHGPWKHDKR